MPHSWREASGRNMEAKLRKTGIPSLGDVPWGAHICQFYKTKDDLVDMLVPYFQAGLENNEFCLWMTSDPVSNEEARGTIRQAIPQYDRYVAKGQIEIVPFTEWYFKDGDLDLRRVLQRWIEKLNQTLAQGYDGMRIAGNVTGMIASHEKASWNDFAELEQELDRTIGNCKMLVLCTYALDKCGATGIIDVVRKHQFVLMKWDGAWERLETTGMSESALLMLSGREREVLTFVAHGHTNQEIADRLHISVKTVEAYRARLMEKLGLNSRAGLVRFALEHGLLTRLTPLATRLRVDVNRTRFLWTE